MKKFGKTLFIFFVFVFSLFSLCACTETTDKNQSYFSQPSMVYTCDYDEAINRTDITVGGTVFNHTIFDAKSVKIKIRLTYDQQNKGVSENSFEVFIPHGGQYSGEFVFSVDYKADEVFFQSFSAEYYSFAETYLGWIIGSAVGAGVLLVLCLIFVAVKKIALKALLKKGFAKGVFVTTVLIIVASGAGISIVPALILAFAYIAGVVLFLTAYSVLYAIRTVKAHRRAKKQKDTVGSDSDELKKNESAGNEAEENETDDGKNETAETDEN